MPTAEENTVERNFRPRIGKQVSVLYRDGTLQAGAFLSLSGSKTGPKWKKTEAPDQNFPLSEVQLPLPLCVSYQTPPRKSTPPGQV